MVDIGLMMMMMVMVVIRRQTHVRQTAVRGEAVTAGGLHGIMLRRRSPIITVRILGRYLGGRVLRRFRIVLRIMLRGMRHSNGTQR